MLFLPPRIGSAFHFGPRYPLSRDELLSPEAPLGLTLAFRHLKDARVWLSAIFLAKDCLLILRQNHNWSAQQIEASLRATLAEADSPLPLGVLANYLARVAR